jgi:hypothetical protein
MLRLGTEEGVRSKSAVHIIVTVILGRIGINLKSLCTTVYAV